MATTTNITLLISTVNDGMFSTQHLTLPIAVQGTLTADDNQRLIDAVQRETQAIMSERKAPQGDDASSRSKALYDGAIQIIDSTADDNMPQQDNITPQKRHEEEDKATENPSKKKKLSVATPTSPRTPVYEVVSPHTPTSPVFAMRIERQETEVIPADEAQWRAPLQTHEAPRPLERQETEVIPEVEAEEAEEKEEKEEKVAVVIPIIQNIVAERIRRSKLPKCRGVVGRGIRKGLPCQWRIIDETLNLCKVHLNQHDHKYQQHKKNKRTDEFIVRIKDLIAKRSDFARKFPPLSLERSTSSDVHC